MIQVKSFLARLPYENTEWGRFYSNYENQSQLKLQKFIAKTKAFRNQALDKTKGFENFHENVKLAQKIFFKTQLDAKSQEWHTPKILISHNLNMRELADDSDKSLRCPNFNRKNKLNKLRKIALFVVQSFLKRQSHELQQVEQLYKQRQQDLAISQRLHRREHAKEMVECPICKVQMTRTNLSRHFKYSDYCLRTKNQIIAEAGVMQL